MKPLPLNLRFARGSAALRIIIVVLVLAAAAGGAWWYLNKSNSPSPVSSAQTATTPAAPGSEAAPAVVSPAVEGLSIDQLYREARKAMAEQRLVAPVGNNALEFYLAILEKDPTNSGASDALRELFPFASGTVEQEINRGDLDEANRIIDSLAKADPSNYTLTILRSKLDARRKLLEQQQAQAAADAAAPVAPVAKPPVETTTTEATPAAEASSASTPPSAVTPPPAVQTPEPKPVAAPAPKGENREVQVVTPVAPNYPPQAARNREEGWAEVEFTVTAEGNVQGAKVTASDPPRTFDREAIRSIERTKFSPRLENGVPVESTVRRRIEFKLGR